MEKPALRVVTLAIMALVLSSPATCLASETKSKDADGWVTIFDGKSLKGWRINENRQSWSVKDGAIVANGPRSHLFYVGDERPFVNFEFKADVMTRPRSNSGIYFHTKFLKKGFPVQGYECQVNTSHGDPQKTGGLYGIGTAKVFKAPAKDNEWFSQHIIVNGKRVIVKIDGKTVVDYTEPEGKKGPVRLSKGAFAFQAHDPGSTVYFKNIQVKRLP